MASVEPASTTASSLVQPQTCYFSDQTAAPDHIACNASAPVSLCCQQGATCLTSGLCFLEWDHSLNTGSCTDMTWTDPSCFQQCPQSPGNGFHVLFRCNDNLWCCAAGANTTSCCNDCNVDLFGLKGTGLVMGGTGFQNGFTIAPVKQSRTIQSPAFSSTFPTATASSNFTNVQTPFIEYEGRPSDATKAGVGAGLGVGLPLLVGLTVALLFLRRLKNRTDSQRKATEEKTHGVVMHWNGTASYELPEMEILPSEMANSRSEITQELGPRD